MPPAPPSLSSLSEAELQDLEAEGRRGLEARLQCLQNIHTLLDAAMLNIHHYLSTVATLSPPRTVGARPESSESSSSEAAAATETAPAEGATAAEATGGAAALSQPADSTSAASESEVAEPSDDAEPNAAELRRRRLRKLQTPTSPAPPED